MTDELTIGDFVFLPVTGTLMKDGAVVPLGGRALAVLCALAASKETVTKGALLDAAWPGVTVEEGNLAVQIAALRNVLGDEAIITVPRIGYRLRRSELATASGLPRLAVLPFEILGGTHDDVYFADGLAEDIVAALGRFRQFGVITRQAAVAQQQRLAELGIRYALAGTIRRAGNLLRIAAHLSDTITARQIWSHQMEGTLDDLFAFQDSIAQAVAISVAPEIEAAEIAGACTIRSASLSAYDLYLRALPDVYAETEAGNLRARDLLDRALAEEPENPLYLIHAAWVLEHRSAMGWPLFDDDHRPRCIRFARKALSLAQGDSRVLTHAALALVHMRDYDLALAAAERAVRENPNNALALVGAAVVYLHVGDLERIPEFIDRLEALDPNDPLRHIRWSVMASYYVLTDRPERAVERASVGLAMQPNFDPLYWMMIAAQVALGRIEEARQHVAALRTISPYATISSIRAGQPRKFPERIDPILTALQTAGLPEA